MLKWAVRKIVVLPPSFLFGVTVPAVLGVNNSAPRSDPIKVWPAPIDPPLARAGNALGGATPGSPSVALVRLDLLSFCQFLWMEMFQ